MTLDLPVAANWYRREEIEPGVTKLLEPYVDRVEQSNLWHVRGRDLDLLIDGGMGIVPLRPAFPDLCEGPPVLAVATHTHLDHVGAMHEFPERWVHVIEAGGLSDPRQFSLLSDDLDPKLRQTFVAAGYAPLGPYLIDALPFAGYDLSSYRLNPAPATRLLQKGDVVDLGDKVFEVLLLPGHSPGGIALWGGRHRHAVRSTASIVASASRLLFSLARDRLIAGHAVLSRIDPRRSLPIPALVVVLLLALLVLSIGFASADAATQIVSFATAGIYTAFQIVIGASLLAALGGWRPAGAFRLGMFGFPVRLTAFVFGVAAVVNLAWPRAPEAGWFANWFIVISMALIIATGLLQMTAQPANVTVTRPAE